MSRQALNTASCEEREKRKRYKAGYGQGIHTCSSVVILSAFLRVVGLGKIRSNGASQGHDQQN